MGIDFIKKGKVLTFFITICLGVSNYSMAGWSTELKFESTGQGTGRIGITPESPVDNPSDNIFHVVIDQTLYEDDQVWLVYELEGVEDHTSVSRSINDHLSVGGYLVKKSEGWKEQRESIDATWLREGDNVIRFTIPEGAAYSYRIRNLAIEVEHRDDTHPTTRGSTTPIVINQPETTSIYENNAYLKGFVLPVSGDVSECTDSSEEIQLTVDGVVTQVFDGEFEAIVKKRNHRDKWTVEIEAIYPNGQIVCQEVEINHTAEADYRNELTKNIIHAEKLFLCGEDGFISLKGATLSVPAGSLEMPSYISITTLRGIDIPALDAGMVNVTQYHDGYRFLPHGTAFANEVSLQMGYDETKIPDGYTADDVKTYYFDELAHHWVPLPRDSVLVSSNAIASGTTHFTDMINAIIKVPESPEVQAYNSTSMKGIKAANPTAAVNLINPPQANNTGNASLGYPINLPAGRNGMQPQVAISYNSGGGNGWMGLGWNLSIPSVGIDTRWGVPRYDPDDETETYTMNGEQLTPVAHRSELEARSGDWKQFYPRVEGAFNKIIRHGKNPKEYWWEVTDKSGTKYIYGGDPLAETVDENAVLTDADGNIAHWALVEVKELNGNFVRYHYAKQQDKGFGDGESGNGEYGYNIYVSRITYTGHGTEEGKYSVVFMRDRELGEGRRKDVSIDARLGFKQVTADLLQRIAVMYGEDTIRSYKLKYEEGAFHKTLLTRVTEYDADGKEFNHHDFEYYDEVRKGEVYEPFKETSDSWEVGNDGKIRGDFVKRIEDEFDDNASMLSGTKSTDKSLGMAVTVGFNPQVYNKTFSVGGSFNASTSKSESLLTMLDLNGDGLPDKVFMKGDEMFYRPNLAVTGEQKFGDPVEITHNGNDVDAFFKEKSKTKSGGLEAHGPAVAPVFGGYSASKTKSEQSVYFTEVNGDQLPDLVYKGKVYFNRINPDTGHPEFVDSSDLTPSPIHQGSNVAGIDQAIDAEALEKALDENPLHDVVKRWEAPYSGRIKITGDVQLVEIIDEDRDETLVDGVRVAIQQNDDEKWDMTIEADDYNPHAPAGVENLSVNKGDKIYFRVGSNDNGSYDQVSWAPVIEYLEMPFSFKTDANQKSYWRYSSEEDFKLSAVQKVSPPEQGSVNIEIKFTKPVTTDDVQLEVIRETTDPSNEENPDEIIATDTIWIAHLNWEEEKEIDTLIQINVDKGQQFRFKVHSNTNVDWSSINWRPRMYYTALSDPKFAGEVLVDSLGNQGNRF